MRYRDTQYERALGYILKHGTLKQNRTGVDTIDTFGAVQLSYELRRGLPLVTTKRLFTKGVVAELLWLISGDTNIAPLLAQNVHIWDEWADPQGELGPVYGAQWRHWRGPDGEEIDQLARAIELIKTKPDSRQNIVSAWNVADIPRMALPPCHAFYQFDVTDGRLSLQLYQRSADMFLGVPFNLLSYSLLTHMVAQQTGLEVGKFVWTAGSAHIYTNHLVQVREQLSRPVRRLPTLELAPAPSIDDYTPEHFEIVGYNPHPPIKAPVAV